MQRLFRLSSLLTILVCLAPPSNAAYCDANTFGRPTSADCLDLAAQFPLPSTARRIFIEQPLRPQVGTSNWEPSFRPRDVSGFVQLPKIWSRGTCNIALLSFRGLSRAQAASITNYGEVVRAAIDLLSVCSIAGAVGGATFVERIPIERKPAMALYLYDNMSGFNTIMNQYQSLAFPEGINFFRPLQDLSNLLGIGTGSVGARKGWENSTRMSA